MEHPTSSHSHKNGSAFWTIANGLLALVFGGTALALGGALLYGVGKYSKAVPAPAEAAAAPAVGGTATAAPVVPLTPQQVAADPKAAPVAAAPSAGAPAAGGAADITIKPDAINPMSYDVKSFSVKAGQKVKFTFANVSAMPLQHNWILGKAGSKERLIGAANAMLSDPAGLSKGYIPTSPDILQHTKLLNQGESQTIEFTAPAEAGEYPYLCSFPGHSLIMNGVMKVE